MHRNRTTAESYYALPVLEFMLPRACNAEGASTARFIRTKPLQGVTIPAITRKNPTKRQHVNYINKANPTATQHRNSSKNTTNKFAFLRSAVYLPLPRTQQQKISNVFLSQNMITNTLQFFFSNTPVVIFVLICIWFHRHHVSWRPLVLL